MLPISAVPLSVCVWPVMYGVDKVGVAGAAVSSVKLPEPGVMLPAASALLIVTGFEASAPSEKLPEIGEAVAVLMVHTPLPLAVVV